MTSALAHAPVLTVPQPLFEIVTNANDEESVRIFCNSVLIRTLTHDDDGWSGMETGKTMIVDIAKACGGTVIYRDSLE